jgi:TusA-related sulfurtransferase
LAQAEKAPDGFVTGVNPSEVLDLRGVGAGQAGLVVTRNTLERLAEDEVLEVLLSDGGLRDDLAGWAHLAGHELIADLDASDHTKLLIAKKTHSHAEKPDWGVRMPLRDGVLDLRDWFLGRAGAVPYDASTYLGFVPRGAVADTAKPDFPYRLNRKSDVWADNLPDLYEQAKAQQWNASTDIAWADLKPLPEPVERAVCQLMTFLAENEYAALYIPAKFLPRINAQFVEPVMFLATIINDEARHIEAFTKRALANGGGLQYSSALTEWSLHGLFVQEDYFRSSFLLHVLGEGTFLDLLDFIERHSPDAVTADVVRRARRDEGRHVAYGIAHVREVLHDDATKAEELVAAAEERSETLAATTGANPAVVEALAVLAAHGQTPNDLAQGFDAVGGLFEEMHRNRVRRMLQVGLDPATADKISHLHTPNFM